MMYFPERVRSKVTLDINMKCKNHREGKMKSCIGELDLSNDFLI